MTRPKRPAISAKLRRDAADGCAIMATLRANANFAIAVGEVLRDGVVVELAWKAFDSVAPVPGTMLSEYWAESEAMLREGWVPGVATGAGATAGAPGAAGAA